MANEINGGTLDEVTITAPANQNNSSGNIWDMIGTNLGGWLSGTAQVITAANSGNQPNQNFNPYNPNQIFPQQRSNTWLWVAIVAVVGVVLYMVMQKGK